MAQKPTGPGVSNNFADSHHMSMVKEIEGDVYTVTVRSTDASAGSQIDVQFVAFPD